MTLSSVIVLANLMTDESRKKIKDNPTSTYEEAELEGTIKLKFKTIDALKDLSYNNNHTYDQIIMSLIRSYSKRNDENN